MNPCECMVADVCITVPIRACFPTDIRGNNAHLDVLSGVWIVDTLTDIYFIIDVFLNFFTALPNQYDGTPIADRRQIAEHCAPALHSPPLSQLNSAAVVVKAQRANRCAPVRHPLRCEGVVPDRLHQFPSD